ncbi:hypothetical protein OHA25_00490 [Nonomuraea sp. NBC_00507]|uniref:hypothetical protein n=1 Tax=Nonomuraea sp. NBC_00507 TaxID=2976002 RepID=UPI002E1917AB
MDVVLLSRDQHPDNLDRAGRAYLTSAPLVLSTGAAAERVGVPVRGLPNWTSVDVGGVSGDNASLDVVRAVAERVGPVDVALLFAGGARSPLVGVRGVRPPAPAARAGRTDVPGRVMLACGEQALSS